MILRRGSNIKDPLLVFLYKGSLSRIPYKGLLYKRIIKRTLHWDCYIKDLLSVTIL